MAKIYRLTDRIDVKVHDLTFKLSPLSMSQKQELHSHVSKGNSAGDMGEILTATRKAIKYCVKGISGLEDCDGNDYELSFDGDGSLSDECVEDLLNMEYQEEIALMCMTIANKVPEEFLHADGTPMKGISRVKKPAKTPKKRKSNSPN